MLLSPIRIVLIERRKGLGINQLEKKEGKKEKIDLSYSIDCRIVLISLGLI